MTLAVLVPVLGTRSETFVRRHVHDLSDGAVVIGRRRAAAADRGWDAPGEVLLLDDLGDSWCGPVEQAAVARFLRAHSVSAVLGEFLDVWLDLVPLIAGSGMRIWGHAHGYDVSSRLRDPWWRDAYSAWRAASGVVTMSEVSRERLTAETSLQRVEVVPYGVDVPSTAPTRRPNGRCTLLAVGRMVPKKAPLRTLRAFQQAASTRPDLHLVLAGGGPLLGDVQASAGARVLVPGQVTSQQVGRLLAAADVFAQHSVVDPETGDEEGLPVAILEAMAAGLPVVTTRHAGIPEAVVDGVTGFLVEEGDEESMAEAIGRLADDPALRHEMGHAGWERARELFTWEREREALRRLLWPSGAPGS